MAAGLVEAYLGFGSNLGDREENIRRAVELLSESVCGIQASSLYETEPWGYVDQPKFLNMVCRCLTRLEPEELLSVCRELETLAGREPSFKYGPRVLDVDILAYGDAVVKTGSLAIPHSALHERAFVLAPLAEVAPHWRHPILNKTADELLAQINGTEGVRLWGPPLVSTASCAGEDWV